MRVNSFGTRAYTYRVINGPNEFPVSLQTARSYLKIKTSVDDPLINLLISQATDFAEKFTGRDFITRSYQTFRDFFPNWCDSEGYYRCGDIPGLSGSISTINGNLGFEIRRSQLISVTEISYLRNSIPVVVDPAIFYNTLENDYSEILTNPNQTWPEDVDRRLQSITITFTCGFASSALDLPPWIKEGMLQHIALMYENRGDCMEGGSSKCLQFLPATAKGIYLQNRIQNL